MVRDTKYLVTYLRKEISVMDEVQCQLSLNGYQK